jgi:hypothetical protein
MCTSYYSQLQIDNGEMKEQLELLSDSQSPGQEVARLRQLNADLQRRVEQLEDENASISQIFMRTTERKSELPAVRGSRDQVMNFRLASPVKKDGRRSRQ